MNFIFCRWDNLMEDKLISALERKGHTVLQYTREFCDKDYDTEYLKDFVDFV